MASYFVRKSDKGELSTCRHGHPKVTCRLLYKSTLFLVFGLLLLKWMNGVESSDSNQECKIGFTHVPYCYLFLPSVFIFWFSYVSNSFCKF